MPKRLRPCVAAVVAASLLVACTPTSSPASHQRRPSDAPSGERAHPVQQEAAHE